MANLVPLALNPATKNMSAQPAHPALILTDGTRTEQVTYGEFLKQSDHLASALDNHEKPTPTRAIVILPKIIPWWIINIAGSLCDMVISPGSLMLTEKDIVYRVKTWDANAIFCDVSVMKRIEKSTNELTWRILVGKSQQEEEQNLRDGWIPYHKLLSAGKELKPIRKTFSGESMAQLFFTSGTTGRPKMVPHTQAGLGLGHRSTAREWLGLNSKDLLWNISDLGWAKAAYSSLYAPLIAGCTIFAHKVMGFDSKKVLRILEEMPISVLCLPPTALRSLVQENLSTFKPRSLRKCVSAGEPLNIEIAETWHKYTGLHIYEGYGQTESSVVCSSAEGVKLKPGTIGKAVHGYDLKIIDKDFCDVKAYEVGQMAYSLKNGWPYGLFKGYLKSPERNKKAFANGYYLTGDKAYFDDDGYVCYVGRDDDIIISAGYRIGPFDVESALVEHPAVYESAAVASPDEHRGHVVKAYIVLNDKNKALIKSDEGYASTLAKEIQDFVKSITAPYKYPRKIEFVDSLPKTISGKIRRVELRQRENAMKKAC